MSNSLETASINIEEALVARNLRGMAHVRPALQEGYCLRAAQTLFDAQGVVLIGTGFPVTDTFETDGPLGAIALYKSLEKVGSTPYIVCGAPLSEAIKNEYRVIDIKLGKHDAQNQEAQTVLDELQPKVVFSIERPGQAEDGHYYNMRGENISARAACFDSFMNQATCPTIAIGDGGNEIGMGNVTEALKSLDIVAATTKCDELIVADVSNWGAYGLIAMLGKLANTDLLAEINPLEILRYLSSLGSVDGVTRLNQLTEDGQEAEVGDAVILELRRLSGF
ncbi:DUF4392 domain-containing protein [Marinomonas sp. C2222]|uniref:DUF4392 domain-containing protein n=1 Tax=Marinomonas sargassi TaxID=2984494 RepID=A0ABT2YSV8_9GAMM|nr:DUF4392 domain-containing protein [Marinomonas sargassi]MCV2402976.1 DUF4392 domain-containing protein [Marinomonas sargassi]